MRLPSLKGVAHGEEEQHRANAEHAADCPTGTVSPPTVASAGAVSRRARVDDELAGVTRPTSWRARSGDASKRDGDEEAGATRPTSWRARSGDASKRDGDATWPTSWLSGGHARPRAGGRAATRAGAATRASGRSDPTRWPLRGGRPAQDVHHLFDKMAGLDFIHCEK